MAESSLQLEVHGLVLSGQVSELLDKQVKKLEARFGRTTSCRVTLRAPGQHHRVGEPFIVNIRLGLPSGLEVNVGPSRAKDPRFANLIFAIHEAFRRATSQLDRRVERLERKNGPQKDMSRRRPRVS